MRETAIPPQFYAFDTEGPFSECSICGKPLQRSAQNYAVERVMQGEDVLFEYAACVECSVDMQEQLSEDSKKAIMTFFAENIDYPARMRRFGQDPEAALSYYMTHCAVSGRPISEMKRYQLIGMFEHSRMQLGLYPMVIGEEAILEMSEMISEQTRGWMDGFVRQINPVPPELEEIFKGGPVLVL